jgi:hypothetical protein
MLYLALGGAFLLMVACLNRERAVYFGGNDMTILFCGDMGILLRED